MKSKKKKKTITIMVVVDPVGVLSADSLKENLYLFDNNKANGSVNHGTEALITKLTFNPDEEITLLWNVLSIEPESFVGISQVVADEKYIEIKKSKYKGSDIEYWTGIVKKPFEQLSYSLSIQAGSRDMEFPCNLNLVGDLKLS